MTVRFLVAAALVLAACNQATINTPIRSFDRPTDAALLCVRVSPAGAVRTAIPCPPLTVAHISASAASVAGTGT